MISIVTLTLILAEQKKVIIVIVFSYFCLLFLLFSWFNLPVTFVRFFYCTTGNEKVLRGCCTPTTVSFTFILTSQMTPQSDFCHSQVLLQLSFCLYIPPEWMCDKQSRCNQRAEFQLSSFHENMAFIIWDLQAFYRVPPFSVARKYLDDWLTGRFMDRCDRLPSYYKHHSATQ